MHDETISEEIINDAQTGHGSGVRNRFFLGKWMRPDIFSLEQRYGIERRRMINRAVLGSGIVCGLAVRRESPVSEAPQDAAAELKKPVPRPLLVHPGLALDEHGRELVLDAPLQLDHTNTFVLVHGAGELCPKTIEQLEPARYLLRVHYAERRFGDADVARSCGCPAPEKNYVHEGVVFSLQPMASEPCPCAEANCARDTHCEPHAGPCAAHGRGPHGQLCRWVEETPLPDVHAQLCEWRGHWIGLHDGLALACVHASATQDKCRPLSFDAIEEDCAPRRLVKNNDLLYDLVRGCDLTRIAWISWGEWHRAWHKAESPIAWSDFADKFRRPEIKEAQPAPTTKGEDGGKGGHRDCSTGFVVRFSGPVKLTSLHPDSIVMTAFTLEQATGWQNARRVPLTKLLSEPDLKALGPNCPLPEGTTNQVRLCVSSRWLRDEIEGDKESWLSERDFTIELEVRGDLILDCHGQALDGNVNGNSETGTPSGNGDPGGTFVSSFRVQRKPVDDNA
jgi:hypothetical protein